MRTMRRPIILGIAATFVGAAALAQSSGPVSALKGHNSNAPIDVSADRIAGIFDGEVVVTGAVPTP